MNEDINWHLLYIIVVIIIAAIIMTVYTEQTISKIQEADIKLGETIADLNISLVMCKNDLNTCKIQMDSLEDSYVGRYEQ